ncbi:hypothetical protein BGW80DRAFT_1346648 [Lactifluus volemus]|nr:hypothetical protein BGW80DRAFT_1368442 [Lactifluus volemus]KAH9964776.1 hypothetical protein BGW80DRAFT_1346648 [Lactifluus volemus]
MPRLSVILHWFAFTSFSSLLLILLCILFLCLLLSQTITLPRLKLRSILSCDPFSFPYHYVSLSFDVPCPTKLIYFSFVPDLHLVS